MLKAYGPLWSTPNGQMLTDDGYASQTFIDWAVGTERLTDENWAYGLMRMEEKMRAAAANNKDAFPPQTVVIWCSWCFPASPTGNQITKAAGQASQSFKKHPNITARDNEQKLIAADPGYTERKKEAGNSALKNMMESL